MRLHRNIWVVTITSFLTDISSEMVVHVLPMYLRATLGVSMTLIGLIDGMAELTASLVKIVAGRLSDRIRSRKWFAVAGYAVSTIAKPLLLVATSWPIVLAVRCADRVGKGLRNPPRDALVADSADDKARGVAFGLHRAGDTLGAFLGVGVAAWVIMTMTTDAQGITTSTFNIIVGVSIVPAVLAVIVLAAGARDVLPKQDRSTTATAQTLPASFKRFLGIVVLFTLGNATDAFIVLRGRSLGMSVVDALLMVMTFTAVYTVASIPFGRWSDRVGRRRVIIVGWTFYALVYVGLGMATSAWQVWALFGCYGLYYAATEGVVRAHIADNVPDKARGAAYGAYHAAVGIAAIPASAGAGALWELVGPEAMFFTGAALAAIATVLFAWSTRRGDPTWSP